VREHREIPGDGVIYPEREFLDSLYDLERDIEEGSPLLLGLIKEMMERIIEKRLEYYIWPLQETEESEE
jgi:hypothetical protein